MKKPNRKGMAFSESLYGFAESEKKTNQKLANPTDKNNLPDSFRNCQKDARNTAILLNNIQSGYGTYWKVVKALQAKYGQFFLEQFCREVEQ